MNKRALNFLKYLVSFLIAVALLYFCFRNLKWEDFVVGLKSCKWGWILASMAIGILAFFLRSLRWRLLLLPIDKSTSLITTFNAVNISYLVNIVLPKFGEFIRCGFITKHSDFDESGKRKASYDKVLGTVVMERSWDVFMLFIIVLGFITLGMSKYGSFFMDGIIRPFAAKINFNSTALLALLFILIFIVIYLIIKLKDKNKICGKIADFFIGLWQGIKSSLQIKNFKSFIALTIGIWICYWLMSATIVFAVQGMDLSSVDESMQSAIGNIKNLNMVDALFLMMAGSLSSLIPVPGGFGAFHWVVATALSTMFGVPFSIGIMFATLSHESQLIVQILCGALSYIYETIRS